MRESKLIRSGSPCDIDYYDETIQKIVDFKARGRVLCSNYIQCKKMKASCYRRVAQMLAGFVLDRKESFYKALKNERQEFLKEAPEGRFWVLRNNVWQIVEGKANVIDEVMEFVKIIIDFNEGDRRPFTDDGKDFPEIDMDSVMKNAALDQEDISNELKQI